MSAIDDSEKTAAIQVLFALHNGFDTLDFAGPMEIFRYARHEKEKPGMRNPQWE
jgi:transcriptional regulator GlxA family with amidase domain